VGWQEDALAFAQQQPSVSAAADDCFACRNVAERTIELATQEACAGATPDERFATVPIVASTAWS
jgi:hypothetical protein